MLGEQRKWDFAPQGGVPGIHYRDKDGKLQWKEITAARKREMESQGYDVDAIIKDWARRYEQRTGKPYVKPRPSSVPPGSFNVTPQGTVKRKELDAKIEREIKANAEAQRQAQPAPEPKRVDQSAQVLGIDRRTPLNKDGTLPTRIGLSVKGDTPMQQWAKNFPKLAKRVLKKKTPQAGYGEIEKIKSQLGEQMDTFDTIKEYLLSEGYAASEGAAHAIMTSMSEEWKKSILEQMLPPIDPKKHKAAQKTQKIYNKATQGAGSEKDFLKRTGPQLPRV